MSASRKQHLTEARADSRRGSRTVITLPAIGETIHTHGGSITRVSENSFAVVRADGKRDMGCNRAAKPEIKFIVAMNILRTHAGLEPLPLPCLYCLENPRRGTNAFCCGQHEALHYGHAPRPVKRKGVGSQPKREQPMPPHAAIMESLSKIKRFADPLPEVEIVEADAPLLVMHQPMRCSAAFKAADALIARRHAYAVLDDCLLRAWRRQLAKQEQAS